MNFNCNATIVGFIVAGANLNNGPHSQVQIWHKNSSQSSIVYYLVGSFSVDTLSGSTVCVAEGAIISNTRWCILRDNFQISVQPGDIFGLELPRTNNDEIFFTSGGPVNYVFGRQLDSNVNLSNNGSYSNAQQLPQIVFNLTSGINHVYSSQLGFNISFIITRDTKFNNIYIILNGLPLHTRQLTDVVAMLKNTKYMDSEGPEIKYAMSIRLCIHY